MASTKAPRAATTPSREAQSQSDPGRGTKAKGRGAAFLRATNIPGVFLNKDGSQVDEHGVLLSLREVLRAEEELTEELGEPNQTPAQFLRRVALDPRLPLPTRMQAAVASAPYFDRKMPIGLEGGDPNRPIKTDTTSTVLKGLEAMRPEDRKAALSVLEKLGLLG